MLYGNIALVLTGTKLGKVSAGKFSETKNYRMCFFRHDETHFPEI
jgi:hypothetical protein